MTVSITVPNTFATQSGNVPASELDANFTALANAFALFLSADGTQGPTAPLAYSQPLTLTPATGQALNVTGASNTTAVVVTSGNASNFSNGDVIVQRAGSVANQNNQGPNFEMVDSVASSGSNIQWSGNQFEIWQGITGASPVHWQMAYFDSNGGLHLPGSRIAQATLTVVSSTGAAVSGNDIVVNRAGSTVNTIGQGPNINLADVTNSTNTLWQNSGGQSELWQFNGGWQQILKVATTRGVTINAPASGNTLTVTGVAGGTPLILAPGNNAAGFAINNGGTAGTPMMSVGTNYFTTGAQTATFSATNKPGSGTTAPTQWLVIALGATTYYIPCWQ